MTKAKRSTAALGLLAGLGLLTTSCAAPSGTARPPSRDAANTCAEVSVPPRLGAALREDPPLPGTWAEGWPQLDAGASEASLSREHEHAPGHDVAPGGSHARHH